MPIWINKASLYLFAWSLYYSQGLILPVGSVFGQILVALLLVVSLYYFFVANTRYKVPAYFYGLNVLLIMFFIYGLYLILAGYDSLDYSIHVNQSDYLKQILISLIPVYPFFVFSKENLIDEKFLAISFFLLFCLTVGNYYENQSKLLYMALLKGSKTEEFTNNVGYEFLALIPLSIFLYKKPMLQYLALGACVLFLILSMKRGAIVIGLLCLLWYVWNNVKKVSIKKKIGFLTLFFIICAIGYFFVELQMQNSVLFQKRIEDSLNGNSSGRDGLYSLLIGYFWNGTSPLQFIFGSGANATLKVASNYAHNDWLEIAVNQGVVGIIVFAFYWVMFVKEILSNSFAKQVKLALQLVVLTSFLQTIFSMSYGSMGYITMLTLGFCLAKENANG